MIALQLDSEIEREYTQAALLDARAVGSQVVRAHGGRMSVTSSREKGTEFTARLPLTEPRALDVAAH